jgi:O-acetyl-ADP-ribose deacetylase (regulator of RNase III)
MIEHARGNLLEAQVDALVNTVNTVGVMGKGIALQFRMAFPKNYDVYKKACARGEVQPGHMFVVPTGELTVPQFIINFPTKRHWKEKSRLTDIQEGLVDLVRVIREQKIRSLALPPLGCGNGGLEWAQVKPLIEKALAPLDDVHILLYAPEGAPAASAMRVRTERPRMTQGRAAFLKLLASYTEASMEGASRLVLQKLAYLLQEVGERLNLTFIKAPRGPYAGELNRAFQSMEGHFLRGHGDGTGAADVHPLPEALLEAEALLRQYPDAQARVERARQLTEGFESPHGLELLATVHWIARENPESARELESMIQAVHAWNERKQREFPPFHIEAAWKRLHTQGWIPSAPQPLHSPEA